MKVRDLIDLLEGLNEDEEILFVPNNSNYPEDFSKNIRRDAKVIAYWGPDYKATILFSKGQVGGLSYEDDEEED